MSCEFTQPSHFCTVQTTLWPRQTARHIPGLMVLNALVRPFLATVRTFDISVHPRQLALDIATAAGLGFAGDVLCQVCVEKQEHFDKRRAASLAFFNAVYCGGFLHILYQFYTPVACFAAARIGAPRSVQAIGSSQHAAACALVDNAHNGAIYIPAYFLGVGLLQGQSLCEAWQALRSEWWETYLI